MLTGFRGPGLERAVVSSFETDTLERVGRLAALWPRWLNTEDLSDATIRTATDLACRGVSVDWHAIDARSFARARAADLEVAAWTVRRLPTYRKLERIGVAAICVEAAALDG